MALGGGRRARETGSVRVNVCSEQPLVHRPRGAHRRQREEEGALLVLVRRKDLYACARREGGTVKQHVGDGLGHLLGDEHARLGRLHLGGGGGLQALGDLPTERGGLAHQHGSARVGLAQFELAHPLKPDVQLCLALALPLEDGGEELERVEVPRGGRLPGVHQLHHLAREQIDDLLHSGQQRGPDIGRGEQRQRELGGNLELGLLLRLPWA
mmetsp:Transcript_43440/g.107413  ORF Transcript_43440/g.107413 Transcript_43440/m.107413 type:complete len:212 (+) Transcript_43440:665-1300(+)